MSNDYEKIKMPMELKAWVIDRALAEFDNPEWETLTKNLLENCWFSYDIIEDKFVVQLICEMNDIVILKTEDLYELLMDIARHAEHKGKTEEFKKLLRGVV